MRRYAKSFYSALAACAIWAGSVTPAVADFRAETFESFDVTPLGVYVGGNRAFVTEDATETTWFKKEIIRNAQESIEIAGSYLGGQLLQEILADMEELLESHEALKVHIIGTDALMSPEDVAAVERLSALYPDRFTLLYFGTEILQTLPTPITTENHVKIVVVDGKYAVVGGTSLEECLGSDEVQGDGREGGMFDFLLQKGARDADVIVEGPIVATLRVMYFELFHKLEGKKSSYWPGGTPTKAKGQEPHRYFPLQSEGQPLDVVEKRMGDEEIAVKATLSGPDPEIYYQITKEYLSLFQRAKHHVFLGNLYLHPNDELFAAMMDMVNRGVSLDIITNGTHEASPKTTHLFVWVARFDYLPLMLGKTFALSEKAKAAATPRLDVRIYEFNQPRVIYHKKAMVVDGTTTIVGSYNFGKKSSNTDYEIVLTLESEKVAKQMQATLQEDIYRSYEVSFTDAWKWYFDWTYRWLAGWGDLLNGVM